MTIIDLNCDMGEGFGAYSIGDDAAMLKVVTSANIACGFHAGDPNVIDTTLRLAAENKVSPGAHPGFMDLYGFGRRAIRGERPEDIERQTIYQIGAISALAEAAGWSIQHVKPHGALNNIACVDEDLAMALARAVATVDRNLIFVAMPGTAMERAGERMGLPVAREIFADRAYDDNAMLVSRSQPGSVLHDQEFAAQRVLEMVETQTITSVNGVKHKVRIDTVCVHGDHPGAVEMARAVRAKLEQAGVTLASMREVLKHR